jgi:hypothetical protein
MRKPWFRAASASGAGSPESGVVTENIASGEDMGTI